MSKKTKVWLILAATLMGIGCIAFAGVMTVLHWDFTNLTTHKFETSEFVISEEYHNISVSTKTANIVFLPSENAETTVICYEQQNMTHAVSVKDGTLQIQVEDTRKWYEYIGISFRCPKITVYLPQGEYNALSVKSITGNIEIPKDFAFQSVDLSVSTGDISVSGVTCSGDVAVYVTTGNATITDLQCKNLTTAGTTGDLYMRNVVAAQMFSAERNTGDITLERCDATELYLKTTTGHVTGSLLSQKVFTVSATTGHIEVPQNTGGGKCEIHTTTGNIKITLE